MVGLSVLSASLKLVGLGIHLTNYGTLVGRGVLEHPKHPPKYALKHNNNLYCLAVTQMAL